MLTHGLASVLAGMFEPRQVLHVHTCEYVPRNGFVKRFNPSGAHVASRILSRKMKVERGRLVVVVVVPPSQLAPSVHYPPHLGVVSKAPRHA